MKKVIRLGLIAILSVSMLVGCGGEPKDHIWEAISEIKNSKDFDKKMIQIDGVILPNMDGKEMTFGELRDYFDNNQYSMILKDHGKEIEANTDGDLGRYESSGAFNFNDIKFKVYNKHLEGKNKYIGTITLLGKGTNVVIVDGQAHFKEFNDEYKGGIYLAGGIPASKGAVKKTDAKKLEDAEEYFKSLGCKKKADIESDELIDGGILKVYGSKSDNIYVVYVVNLDQKDGDGFKAAKVKYWYTDGKIDNVTLELNEHFRIKNK